MTLPETELVFSLFGCLLSDAVFNGAEEDISSCWSKRRWTEELSDATASLVSLSCAIFTGLIATSDAAVAITRPSWLALSESRDFSDSIVASSVSLIVTTEAVAAVFRFRR